MKRAGLIRSLEEAGCVLIRRGGKHFMIGIGIRGRAFHSPYPAILSPFGAL